MLDAGCGVRVEYRVKGKRKKAEGAWLGADFDWVD